MSKTNASKEELMQYINMMQGLKDSGIKCEQEISQALRALNDMMFPKSDLQPMRIIVLVDSHDGLDKAIQQMQKLLGVEGNVGYTSKDFIFEAGHMRARIYDLRRWDRDNLAGLEAELVINYSGHSTGSLRIREKYQKRV